MDNELAKVFAQLAELSAEMSKLFSRAAELAGGVDSAEKIVAADYSARPKLNELQQIIDAANGGDVPSIFKLKKLAEENSVAKLALEKLYYDGDKETIGDVLVLPEGLEYVEDGEFVNLKNITKVVLPESLIGIGDDAFEDCTNLEEINFPDGLQSIGNGAFSGCALKEVKVPALTSIGRHQVFGYVEKVIFAEGRTTISNYSFANCSHLKEVIFPKSLMSILNNAFYGCGNLISITYYKRTENILINAFVDKWERLEKRVIYE